MILQQDLFLNIQYDFTRSIFVQVTNSNQLKGSSDHSRDHFDSIRNENPDRSNRYSTTKKKIDSLGSFLSSK